MRCCGYANQLEWGASFEGRKEWQKEKEKWDVIKKQKEGKMERRGEIRATGQGARADRRASQHWPRYLGPNYMLWNFSRLMVIWLHWASRRTDRQRNYNTITYALKMEGRWGEMKRPRLMSLFRERVRESNKAWELFFVCHCRKEQWYFYRP